MQEGRGQRIEINEVSTRDGFQMESVFIPTPDKIRFIDQLAALGYSRIEATSFTSPKAIPALADAEDVMRGITRVPGVVYTVLVPNVRGAHRAAECGADEFNLVMSASETHNLANLHMTREHSFRQLAQVAGLAVSSGIPVNVSLSCAFGCPMQGDIPSPVVHEWVQRFVDIGVNAITLCDTTGMAFPTQVQALCRSVRAAHPGLALTAHFHNTRSMGLVNVVAAIEAGVTRFDMSLGGVGGCPYAPGASGNVATEDVVHMLQCMGYETGMNFEGLLQASAVLEQLVGHPLASQLPRAGHRLTRHEPPANFQDIRQRAREREAAFNENPPANP